MCTCEYTYTIPHILHFIKQGLLLSCTAHSDTLHVTGERCPVMEDRQKMLAVLLLNMPCPEDLTPSLFFTALAHASFGHMPGRKCTLPHTSKMAVCYTVEQLPHDCHHLFLWLVLFLDCKLLGIQNIPSSHLFNQDIWSMVWSWNQTQRLSISNRVSSTQNPLTFTV